MASHRKYTVVQIGYVISLEKGRIVRENSSPESVLFGFLTARPMKHNEMVMGGAQRSEQIRMINQSHSVLLTL